MNAFDKEQTEHLATTLLDYELRAHDPFSSGKADFQRHGSPFDASLVLINNKRSEFLSARTHVRLGYLPTFWSLSETRDTPLEFAAAFDGSEDDRVQAHFLAAHTDLIKLARESGGTDYRMIHEGLQLPPPENLQLRSEVAPIRVFRPPHMAWYTPKAIVDFLLERAQYGELDGRLLTKLVDGTREDTRASQMVDGILLSFLERRFRQKFTRHSIRDHNMLADVVAEAESEAVQSLLRRAGDAYADLGIAVRDASEATMVRGLRMLAKYKRLELLRRMSRAPTLEELQGSNIKDAGLVWGAMPWELFEPVVKAHGNALRGQLLKRTELGHAELAQCLVDHPKRMPWLGQRHDARADTGDRERFRTFKERVLGYFPAVRLRQALTQRYEMPKTRQLVAFYHLTRSTELEPYILPILSDDVRAAMKEHEAPIKFDSSLRRYVEQ